MSNFSLKELQKIIAKRAEIHDGSSYTASLVREGKPLMAKKLGEEAIEVVVATLVQDKAALIAESADLLYHLSVIWHIEQINPEDVMQELECRTRQSGLAEKAARLPHG